MRLAVVRLRPFVRTQVPFSSVGQIRANRSENCAVIRLKLPISLGMECGFKVVVSVHHLAHALEELPGEALAVFRDESIGWAVIENP